MEIFVKYFLIFFLFFSSTSTSAKNDISEDYEVYVNEIIHSFAQDMKKEFGLRCIGSGGQMPHDVEMIGINFVAYQKASIEEARKLEINVTEKLVQKINEHEKIRPYLREYPYKYNRAEVSICFYTKNNDYYSDGSISHVLHVKDKIVYHTKKTNSNDVKPLREEFYEEARKIVENSSIEKK